MINFKETLRKVLIQEGYIVRTPRGREATEKAYKHLNLQAHYRGIEGRLFVILV
jgi:Holliday junction DNA helicase RuvB